MTRLKTFSFAVMLATLTTLGCARQTSDMPPGTAAITNIKTAIHSGQIATVATRDALPALMKNADADDIATANSIVNDVEKGLAGLDKELSPYTAFDASNQVEIKRAVGDTIDFLRQMQKDRVTHIKNPQLESRINLGLDLVSGALALWQPPGA